MENKETGICKRHGTFSLRDGCPGCLWEQSDHPRQEELLDTISMMPLVTEIALRPGEDIEVQIEVVILARENAQRAREAKAVAYAAWEREYKSLLDSVTDTSTVVTEEEDELRALTVKAYEQTGNKTPAVGVSIKIFQTMDYDPKEALKWAMTHQIALSLDKKSFENIAKNTPLEFVTIGEEPRAQIAQNLARG